MPLDRSGRWAGTGREGAFATLDPTPEPETRGPALSSWPVLALDLGATQVRAAVVLPDGARVARFAAETPVEHGPEAVIAASIALLERSRAGAPAEVGTSIDAVGISAPGPLDPARGVLLDPPNLGPAFRDVAFADAIARATQLPAYLDRDTNVAALGEGMFGAARGCRDYLYLTVSSGIGGAVVADGRLLTGPDGTAGELGHVPVALGGPACGCGASGHLEAVASGVALATAGRAAAGSGRSPFLAERARARGIESIDARDVAAGEEAGDPACRELMDREREALAAACVGFANVFDPERIVIGGSIAEHQGERLLGPVRHAVATLAFVAPRRRTLVVAAELGPDVSLAGAQPLVATRRAAQATTGAGGTARAPALVAH